MDQGWCSQRDLAAQCGVSTMTVHRWWVAGKVEKQERPGRHPRFRLRPAAPKQHRQRQHAPQGHVGHVQHQHVGYAQHQQGYGVGHVQHQHVEHIQHSNVKHIQHRPAVTRIIRRPAKVAPVAPVAQAAPDRAELRAAQQAHIGTLEAMVDVLRSAAPPQQRAGALRAAAPAELEVAPANVVAATGRVSGKAFAAVTCVTLAATGLAVWDGKRRQKARQERRSLEQQLQQKRLIHQRKVLEMRHYQQHQGAGYGYR